MEEKPCRKGIYMGVGFFFGLAVGAYLGFALAVSAFV